ncbi:uncharacterized protein LOC129241072 [Anastrepha obliqua]|uniref:uncharacterized protein LOC129241072 n=1 Tax=Anastrepha obliqua TaxID=95512 RepID=UPI00240A8997|nr:uncharacterized protein LOC129241072 [Anastrepha obliqua]
MEIVHYTPTEQELLPTRKILCPHPDCGSTFTNVGNLDMHMKRHHGKQPVKRFDLKGKECAFHCPQLECTYHEMHTSKMHFKTLKYLRQHYQKSHIAKTNICDQCGKAFITGNQLKLHVEKMCGINYACKECGWEYSTMEALLTHGKRKGHKVRDVRTTEIKKISQRKRSINETQTKYYDQETQTEEATPPKCVVKSSNLDGNITINGEMLNEKHVSVNTQSFADTPEPRHIETQTESQMISTLRHYTYNTTAPTMNSSLPPAQLLPPSTHTYTQTYGDLFADSLLGFTDIQTQTNWSSFSDVTAEAATPDEVATQYSTSTAGTCTRCAYDELLVSTETQTSFTQCLLESRTTNGDTDDGAFSNLYQTQHTQTCDMLLGDLFGGQESDLIGGFQSTYTQT